MGCDDDAEGRNEKDSCGSELKKFTEGHRWIRALILYRNHFLDPRTTPEFRPWAPQQWRLACLAIHVQRIHGPSITKLAPYPPFMLPSIAPDMSPLNAIYSTYDYTTCECNGNIVDGRKNQCVEEGPSGMPAMSNS